MVTHGAAQPEDEPAEVIDRRREPDHGRRDASRSSSAACTTETQKSPSRQSVSENPQWNAGRVDQPGQRLVEVERDHPAEHHVEEHQGRAPEAFARQRVDQPSDQTRR